MVFLRCLCYFGEKLVFLVFGVWKVVVFLYFVVGVWDKVRGCCLCFV